jgi:hypothetical protein
MLKKTFFAGLLLSLLFWGVILSGLFTFRAEDKKSYQDLLTLKSENREKSSLSKPLIQKRQKVRKDIFVPEEKNRLHLSLKSEESDLSIRMQNGKPEIVENLKNLECFMQDKLFENTNCEKMQQIRHFTAKEGTYLFPSHKFYTQKVDLSFQTCLGHTLPSTLDESQSFLSGYASEVSFLLSQKNPAFTASHLKAKIREKNPL